MILMTPSLDDRPKYQGLPVPWVARWTGEAKKLVYQVGVDIKTGEQTVRYPHEISSDRDERGMLWQRDVSSIGEGAAEFGQVHTKRQRRSVMEGICQVCGERGLDQPRMTVMALLEWADAEA